MHLKCLLVVLAASFHDAADFHFITFYFIRLCLMKYSEDEVALIQAHIFNRRACADGFSIGKAYLFNPVLTAVILDGHPFPERKLPTVKLTFGYIEMKDLPSHIVDRILDLAITVMAAPDAYSLISSYRVIARKELPDIFDIHVNSFLK